MSADPYQRDPGYGKPPQWGRLYGKFFPKFTCPASRHARIIADDILRDPQSPVRRMLIDAGYEPDHWASSLEVTVAALWETRKRLWDADPVGEQKRRDRLLAKAMKRTNRLTASCDTHPQGGDEGNTSAPFMSGAVPNEDSGDAQNPTGSTS